MGKLEIKEVTAAVVALLVGEWDPLVIGDHPNAPRRYRPYADTIVTMLYSEGTCEEKIARYLESIRIDDLGLNPDLDQSKEVAKKIAALVTSS